MVYNLPKDTLPPQLFPSRYFLRKCNFENHFPHHGRNIFYIGVARHYFQSKNTATVKTVYHLPKVRLPTQRFFRVDVLLNVCNFENSFHITADTYFILVGYARHYFKAQKYGYRQDGKPFT